MTLSANNGQDLCGPHPERRSDALTLAEAVAELERKRDNLQVFSVGHPAIAALECAIAILRRVDTGEAERLLDALPVPCYISRQAWTDDAGETVGLVTVTDCQHRRAIVYGNGETLRAALRELAKEADNGN